MNRNAPGPDPETVHAMFGSIAHRYDRANTVLSGGVHHLWRRRLVNWSDVPRGGRVLDCATGTGDLAIAFARAVGPAGEVVGTDFSAAMLAPAPEKARRAGLAVRFEQADVTALPYAGDSFDVASIAFGIRNVSDRVRGLSEMARVVRPGGRVMVLEFGQPSVPLVRPLFNLYSRRVLPWIGGLLTGNRRAYDYLDQSAGAFPCGDDFAAIMRETGSFEAIEWRAYTGGIAYAYRAVVRS
jgi:demethylmenaquinone methyltransferase/2-methoxy-6-polyprenyl-1,4-benzoquinol methylase